MGEAAAHSLCDKAPPHAHTAMWEAVAQITPSGLLPVTSQATSLSLAQVGTQMKGSHRTPCPSWPPGSASAPPMHGTHQEGPIGSHPRAPYRLGVRALGCCGRQGMSIRGAQGLLGVSTAEPNTGRGKDLGGFRRI